MSRKHVVSLAALVVAGAAMLAACGTQEAGQPTPTPQPSTSNLADSTPLAMLAGTAKSNNAPANTGDWAPQGAPANVAQRWVQLSASSAGDLNPVVVNGKDRVIYRFDKDTTNPPVSNCNGACAVTWPPVEVQPGGKVFLDGIRKSEVGVIKRADGNLQLTLAGSPLYFFSKDVKPFDTNGQGVGGTWFAIEPNGSRNTTGVTKTTPPATTTSSAGSSTTLTATSAILDSGKNLTEPNGSQGIGGPGCANVGDPSNVSSISASGTYKLWTGPNCTGKSAIVTGDQLDLSTIGFDKMVGSVKFAS